MSANNSNQVFSVPSFSISSWNVRGINAAHTSSSTYNTSSFSQRKHLLSSHLNKLLTNSDVVLLQETKLRNNNAPSFKHDSKVYRSYNNPVDDHLADTMCLVNTRIATMTSIMILSSLGESSSLP